MQSADDKIAAIVSLLGWVCMHLAWVPGAAHTARQQWVSMPSSLDDPIVAPDDPEAALAAVPRENPFCKGRCVTCLKFHETINRKPDCPPEEKWAREFERVRRQFRVMDVEQALLELACWHIDAAQAVYAVFVEPWPGELVDARRRAMGTKTEAINDETRRIRASLAEDGVQWMAEQIDGFIANPDDEALPKSTRVQILLDAGWTSPTRIAKRVGCHIDLVVKVKAARAERSQRVVSATS